mmetsp:Transcript_26422/g.29439  ORF Transcript_26422/g.29439 Transcript_26422/m.29439 type:complete len:106 (+) Transcript_26422:54-371(+)
MLHIFEYKVDEGFYVEQLYCFQSRIFAQSSIDVDIEHMVLILSSTIPRASSSFGDTLSVYPKPGDVTGDKSGDRPGDVIGSTSAGDQGVVGSIGSKFMTTSVEGC